MQVLMKEETFLSSFGENINNENEEYFLPIFGVFSNYSLFILYFTKIYASDEKMKQI